jgi:hypothetical protein
MMLLWASACPLGDGAASGGLFRKGVRRRDAPQGRDQQVLRAHHELYQTRGGGKCYEKEWVSTFECEDET